MKFAYENLSSGQFESLVLFLCQRLLGMGVQGFSEGPDGGRDAKFVGTADLHPSKAAPWIGTVIIQAKHTNGYNRRFSDSDFFSATSKDTVVGKEVPRISKLRKSLQLEHYMLFSNRRLSGNAESDIRTHISTVCAIPESSLFLGGVEQLELYLKNFPEVAQLSGLDPVDSPLIVSPDDLADLVEAFARHREVIKAVVDNPPTPRVSYETKNRINSMSLEYAREQRRRFLKETAQIQTFLAAAENQNLRELYEYPEHEARSFASQRADPCSPA